MLLASVKYEAQQNCKLTAEELTLVLVLLHHAALQAT